MNIGELTTREMRDLLAKYNKAYKIKSNRKINNNKYKLLNANELEDEIKKKFFDLNKLDDTRKILKTNPIISKTSFIDKVASKPVKYRANISAKDETFYNKLMKNITNDIKQNEKNLLTLQMSKKLAKKLKKEQEEEESLMIPFEL